MSAEGLAPSLPPGGLKGGAPTLGMEQLWLPEAYPSAGPLREQVDQQMRVAKFARRAPEGASEPQRALAERCESWLSMMALERASHRFIEVLDAREGLLSLTLGFHSQGAYFLAKAASWRQRGSFIVELGAAPGLAQELAEAIDEKAYECSQGWAIPCRMIQPAGDVNYLRGMRWKDMLSQLARADTRSNYEASKLRFALRESAPGIERHGARI